MACWEKRSNTLDDGKELFFDGVSDGKDLAGWGSQALPSA
jgi:hypothetical protein